MDRSGGVEKHLECRSTVSRGHFSTGTHGHLHLSHFLHDPDTFIEARGRAARTRSTEFQGERPLHVPVPTRGDGSAVRTIRMEYVCPPPGPTLMVIEWVRQLGGRLVGMRTPRSIYLPSRGCYSYIYFIQHNSISSVARATRTLASLPAGVRARESCRVLLLAKRRMWRAAACCVAALAARARVCGAASQCSRMPSLKCWHAAVCGGLQSVLPSIVQS